MSEAKLNGITIHYEDSGVARPSSDARLRRRRTDVGAAAGALNDAGYRLVYWDMRGHAETESPDDPARYSEALTIADMAALWICSESRMRWSADCRSEDSCRWLFY